MKYGHSVVILMIVAAVTGSVLWYCRSHAETNEPVTPGITPGITPEQADPLPIRIPAPTIAAGTVTPASADDLPATSRRVAVHVTGLKQQASTLHVAVFHSAEGFPKPESSVNKMTLPVAGESAEVSVMLSSGEPAAIAVFQDLDGDGRLTKNGFGLPVEPYGFSNNARSLLGPPGFSQAAMAAADASAPLEIRVR